MKKAFVLYTLIFTNMIFLTTACQKQTPSQNPFVNNNWLTPTLPPTPPVAPTGTVGFWTTNPISWTSNFKIFVSIDNKIKIVDDVIDFYPYDSPFRCGDEGATTDFDLANGHYRWKAWINNGISDTISGYITINGACVLVRLNF